MRTNKTRRLDSRNVKKLPPGEYRDASVPGLIFRVTPTSRAWAMRPTFGGQRPRLDLGPLSAVDEKQARVLARKLIGGMAEGKDPHVMLNRHRSDALTVPDLCEKALGLAKREEGEAQPLKLKPRTLHDWRNYYRHDIEKQLAGIPAAQLSRERIKAWGANIKKRSGYVANRTFEVLRRCYSWAVENEVLSASPFVKLPMPLDEEPSRIRFLSEKELAELIRVLDAKACGYANMVWLLLLTGVRRDSVQSMRVRDIDGDTWTIPDTKNSLPHPVPLSTQARAVIDRQLATIGRRETYLFPKVKAKNVGLTYARLNNRFVQLLRDGVSGDDWHIHDLRRTLSTHIENRFGVDIRVISLILGHVPEGVPKATRIYALGQRLEDRRDALQKWADWLDTLPKKWPKDGPQTQKSTSIKIASHPTGSGQNAA